MLRMRRPCVLRHCCIPATQPVCPVPPADGFYLQSYAESDLVQAGGLLDLSALLVSGSARVAGGGAALSRSRGSLFRNPATLALL